MFGLAGTGGEGGSSWGQGQTMWMGGDHTLLGFFFNAPNLVVWLY